MEFAVIQRVAYARWRSAGDWNEGRGRPPERCYERPHQHQLLTSPSMSAMKGVVQGAPETESR